MHKKKIAVMTMAIIISNFSAATLEVLADEVKNNSTAIEQNVIEEPNIATKIDNSKIESITNNGGQYSNSSIDKAIDNNLNTHILLM